VISGVADILRERVSRYVYLDASVPPDMSPDASFSWADFNPPEAREARLKSVREQGKGAALPAPPPGAFAVTDPSDVAWLQRHLRPMPVGTYIGTFTFKSSGSNGLSRTYIASTKPPYALLASTRNRIRGDNTWSFTTLAAGHDSMVTAPEELATLLMQECWSRHSCAPVVAKANTRTSMAAMRSILCGGLTVSSKIRGVDRRRRLIPTLASSILPESCHYTGTTCSLHF
jgi:hypothetical protein